MTPAGGARILTSTPPSLSPPAEWKPPTEFDLIKEWNAHAGRLATMLGLTLVATTFSLSNGAIHDSLFSLDPNATVSWLLGAELLGLSLVGCFLVMGIGLVLRAMQPPAPPENASRDDWIKLLSTKRLVSQLAAHALTGAVVSLVLAWGGALFSTVGASSYSYGLLGFLSLFAVGWLVLLPLQVPVVAYTLGRALAWPVVRFHFWRRVRTAPPPDPQSSV